MSDNPKNLDLELKLRLRRVFFSQGYWCPLEVELSQFEHLGTALKRTSLTDLDVLAICFDQLFTPHKVVCDCKTGKNVSDANRLFWLKGVMGYFGAQQAYFVQPKIDYHARAIAPKMDLRVLDEADLATLEKSLDVANLPLPLADWKTHEAIDDLWGIAVAKDQKPTKEQLLVKSVYSYLSYSYWYIEAHRNLFVLINHFEKIAHLLNPSEPRDLLLAYTGAERFAYSLLDVVSYVQAQGGSEVVKSARTYLYGGALALKDKEQFFDLLRKATRSQEALDPPALPQILELLNRLLRNPVGASDVLRHLSAAYLWCVHLKNSNWINVNTPTGNPNTAALVLAKDVCETFAKVCGLPEAIFAAIKGL